MNAGFFWTIGRTFASNLMRRRALVGNLVVRDFKQRYVGSAIGWLWGAVHPAVLLLSYWFVFSLVFRVRLLPDSGTDSFALYLFVGILPWLLFQDTVQRSVTAVVDYSNLITKTVFPSEVLPISMLLSGMLNHLLGLLVLLVILGLVGKKLTVYALLVPVYTLLLALFTIGVSWLVASLHVFLRDTAQALSIALIFWFWFTPIFYPPELVPEGFRLVLAVNPMTTVVTGYRNAFLQMPPPSSEHLLILLAWTGVVFVAGALFFRHSKTAFADVL